MESNTWMKIAGNAIKVKYADTIEKIKESAHELHNSVNQTYGNSLPYGYHLDAVAANVERFANDVCDREEDVLPIMFGAYYHDSIEDARLTYNDVKKVARQFMDDEQAVLAAEIVYALTNDKGRSRNERAGEHYYSGIRKTPYAPMIKMADRLANMSYACSHTSADSTSMKATYLRELPHFVACLKSENFRDCRFLVPEDMVDEIYTLLR